MKRKGLDYDLQVRVRKYLEFLWCERMNENAEKEEQILNHLSKSLKEEVMMQSNGAFLKRFKIFSLNFSESVLRKTLNIMKTVRCTPKETIIKVNCFNCDH